MVLVAFALSVVAILLGLMNYYVKISK